MVQGVAYICSQDKLAVDLWGYGSGARAHVCVRSIACIFLPCLKSGIYSVVKQAIQMTPLE